MRPTTSILALAALAALGLGGYLYATCGSGPPPHPVAQVDDDLEMLARVVDAAARPDAMLLVDARSLYVAHGEGGVVEARPRSGGAARTLAKLGAPVTGMALAGGSLFAAAGRTVHRLPVAGGPDVVLTDRLTHAGALAADADAAYVVDVTAATTGLLATSTVKRVPAAGGEPGALGRVEGPLRSLALDDANVYWADALEGTLVAAPKAGGPARTIATERGLPEQVVVAGDVLAWVERRTEALWSMPRTGGPPRMVVQDFAGFAHLVAWRGELAWIDEAAIDGAFRAFTVPLAGGEVAPQSAPVEAVDALATDGTTLFWLRGDVGGEVPAD